MQQFAPDEVEMRETIRDQRAEIAKLKSDLTKAHQDGYAEGRKHRVAAVETHADEMYRAQEEIAKLRAERDEAIKYVHRLMDGFAPSTCTGRLPDLIGALTQIDNLMCGMRSALAAARAALKVEREACDRFWASGTTTRDHTDEAESVIDEDWFWGEWNAHKQRRATEAITVPPNRTGTREESQAIADWHHDEVSRRATVESLDDAMRLIRRVAMAEDWIVAKTAIDACHAFIRAAETKGLKS